MVYGIDITIVNGGFVMVYKPTFTSLGGPHPGIHMGVSENSVPHCTQWLIIIIQFLNG